MEPVVAESFVRDPMICSNSIVGLLNTSDEHHRDNYLSHVKSVLEELERIEVDSISQKDQAALIAMRRHLVKSRQMCYLMQTATDDDDRDACKQFMIINFEDAMKILEAFRPAANRWHDRRRAQILATHPEVANLMCDDAYTPILAVASVVFHFWVAIQCSHVTLLSPCATAFIAAAFVGGFLAFGFQALNHELSHRQAVISSSLIGLISSGCTAVPWFSYYFSGGHTRHHKKAGTPQDIDREAFFWAWERTPAFLDSNIGSVLWASIVALGLPILYVYSLSVCLFAFWRDNIKELCYFFTDLIVTVALHWLSYHLAGWPGLLYFILSMGFSHGLLLHPLIGFWLLQHLCHVDPCNQNSRKYRVQPTATYNGSRLWNFLNMNQLSHVEHHDFSRIPWVFLPHLRTVAPEFYQPEHLFCVSSILDLIWLWTTTRGKKFSFGCVLLKKLGPRQGPCFR